jgi:hypothetical protein
MVSGGEIVIFLIGNAETDVRDHAEETPFFAFDGDVPAYHHILNRSRTV